MVLPLSGGSQVATVRRLACGRVTACGARRSPCGARRVFTHHNPLAKDTCDGHKRGLTPLAIAWNDTRDKISDLVSQLVGSMALRVGPFISGNPGDSDGPLSPGSRPRPALSPQVPRRPKRLRSARYRSSTPLRPARLRRSIARQHDPYAPPRGRQEQRRHVLGPPPDLNATLESKGLRRFRRHRARDAGLKPYSHRLVMASSIAVAASSRSLAGKAFKARTTRTIGSALVPGPAPSMSSANGR